MRIKIDDKDMRDSENTSRLARVN